MKYVIIITTITAALMYGFGDQRVAAADATWEEEMRKWEAQITARVAAEGLADCDAAKMGDLTRLRNMVLRHYGAKYLKDDYLIGTVTGNGTPTPPTPLYQAFCSDEQLARYRAAPR